MKYTTLLLIFCLSSHAQVMTQDYGTKKYDDKSFIISLYSDIVPARFDEGSRGAAGLYFSLNQGKNTLPIILSSTGRSSQGNYSFKIGAGYGKRKQFRKLMLNAQLLPILSIGNYSSFSTEFNLGVSREYGNNLTLRLDIGPTLWFGEVVDYDGVPDPVTFMYPEISILDDFIKTRISIGYKI